MEGACGVGNSIKWRNQNDGFVGCAILGNVGNDRVSKLALGRFLISSESIFTVFVTPNSGDYSMVASNQSLGAVSVSFTNRTLTHKCYKSMFSLSGKHDARST